MICVVVVQQSSTFRVLQSECCLFVKLKAKVLLWNKDRHLECYKVNVVCL